MINNLYNDTLTIKRMVKSENEFKRTVQDLRTIQENVKCRLSQIKLGPTQAGVINKSSSLYKIFLDSDVEVLQNDTLIVDKGGILYHFKASKVIRYTDFLKHQEILVEEVERNEVKN